MSYFGNSTSGATSITIENVVVGAVFQAPVNCLVSGIVALHASTNPKRSIAGIYEVSGNGLTIVGQTSGLLTVSGAARWHTYVCNATSSPILLSGRNYIIAANGYSGTGTMQLKIVSGGVTRVSFANTFASNTLPISISGATINLSGSVSIYAWYTEVSGYVPPVTSSLTKFVNMVMNKSSRNFGLRSGVIKYARKST